MKQRNRLFAMTFCLCTVAFSGKTMAQVTTIDSGMCGANLTWWFTSDSTLRISGSGAMDDYILISNDSLFPPGAPWQSYVDSITTLVIDSGVTTIGDGAFFWCENLTSVTIPYGITSIGNWNFYMSVNLPSVTIPNSVITIGHHAFMFCDSFKSISIPNSVTSIGDWSFTCCLSVRYVTIGDGITQLTKGGNFGGCPNLVSVTIGSNVDSIAHAFGSCPALDTIICKATTPPVLGYPAFTHVADSIKVSAILVIVPCGTLAAYQTSDWGSQFTNIIDDCPPSISGKIMRQDSTLLSSGSVELYQIQSPSPYPLIDVVPIDSNGNYLFTNVSADSCIIRAVPDSSENALPTYYGNTDLWNLASLVVVGGSLQNMDIEIIPQSSLSNGSSFISGYVGQKDGQKSLSQKSVSDPAEDVCVYLQKESLASTWTTIDYTLTNAEGYFEFRNVSAGRYRVILDVPGLETDNPQIVEVGDGDTIQNIEYEITEGGITNKSGDDVGISNYELGMMNYLVYPNPTTGKLTVFSSQLSEIGGEVEIYDVVGQVVFTTTVSPQFPEMIIDISGLSAGLYFLKVDGKVLKVVKE